MSRPVTIMALIIVLCDAPGCATIAALPSEQDAPRLLELKRTTDALPCTDHRVEIDIPGTDPFHVTVREKGNLASNRTIVLFARMSRNDCSSGWYTDGSWPMAADR